MHARRAGTQGHAGGDGASARCVRRLVFQGPGALYQRNLLRQKVCRLFLSDDQGLGSGATGTVSSAVCSLDDGGTQTATVAIKTYAAHGPQLREVVVLSALNAARPHLPDECKRHLGCIVWGEQLFADGGKCKLVTLAAARSNLRSLLPILFEAYHPGRNTRELATLFSDLLWAGKILALSGVCHADLKCANVVRVSDGTSTARLAVVDFASSFLYSVGAGAGSGPTTLLRNNPCATRHVDTPAYPLTSKKNPAWCDAYSIGICCLSILAGSEDATDGFAFFDRGVNESKFGEAHGDLKTMMLTTFGGTECVDREEYMDGVISSLLLTCPLMLFKLASAHVDAEVVAGAGVRPGADVGCGAGVDTGYSLGLHHHLHSVEGIPIERVRTDWYQLLAVIAGLLNPYDQLLAGELDANERVAEPFERALQSPVFSYAV